jgi:GT2 family glycosyltransferase
MFSEEVDWMTRFRRAGWKVLFYPGAEVVHVGGATHGGLMYVENLRGHLRYFAKHKGRGRRARSGCCSSGRCACVRSCPAWGYRDGIRFLVRRCGDPDS